MGCDVAGYSKESQKIVQLYRTKDRYEPSPECEAVVNAKYQSVLQCFHIRSHREVALYFGM